MTTKMRVGAFLVVLCGGLLLVGESRAAVLTVPSSPPYNTTLADWAAVPTIQQEDKQYTWEQNPRAVPPPLPGTTPVQFSLVVIDGLDNHSLTLFDQNSGVTLGPGTYDLNYSIAVVPGGNGSSFLSVSPGDTLVGTDAHATITKTLTDSLGNTVATLVSTDGSTDSTTAVNGLTFLNVNELISVTSGAIFATTDTYVENANVPEPASLAIWGLIGGAGIALSWWRRRAA